MPIDLLILEVHDPVDRAASAGTCCCSVRVDEGMELTDHLPAHLASQFSVRKQEHGGTTLSSGDTTIKAYEHNAVNAADVMVILSSLRSNGWQLVTSHSHVDAAVKQTVKTFYFDHQMATSFIAANSTSFSKQALNSGTAAKTDGATTHAATLSTDAELVEDEEDDDDYAVEGDWDLPPDWVEVPDDEGNIYYYNTTTGESTWDRPGEPDAGDAADADADAAAAAAAAAAAKQQQEEEGKEEAAAKAKAELAAEQQKKREETEAAAAAKAKAEAAAAAKAKAEAEAAAAAKAKAEAEAAAVAAEQKEAEEQAAAAASAAAAARKAKEEEAAKAAQAQAQQEQEMAAQKKLKEQEAAAEAVRQRRREEEQARIAREQEQQQQQQQEARQAMASPAVPPPPAPTYTLGAIGRLPGASGGITGTSETTVSGSASAGAGARRKVVPPPPGGGALKASLFGPSIKSNAPPPPKPAPAAPAAPAEQEEPEEPDSIPSNMAARSANMARRSSSQVRRDTVPPPCAAHQASPAAPFLRKTAENPIVADDIIGETDEDCDTPSDTVPAPPAPPAPAIKKDAGALPFRAPAPIVSDSVPQSTTSSTGTAATVQVQVHPGAPRRFVPPGAKTTPAAPTPASAPAPPPAPAAAATHNKPIARVGAPKAMGFSSTSGKSTSSHALGGAKSEVAAKNADYFAQMRKKEDEEKAAKEAEELSQMTPDQIAAKKEEEEAKKAADARKSNHLTRLGGTFAHKGGALLGGGRGGGRGRGALGLGR